MAQQQDFEKLRERLLENKKWPMRYMFKFIVPNQEGKVDQVVALLPKHGTVSFKHTKNFRHVSVTCVVSMKSADSIIDVTTKASAIEGVISL
ncbi:MAG: DUF493 family protein [Marinilabiliaceae bacterium]|nr:DUF493 family protein [Marinilabiliaceae bacterium]